MSNLVPSVAMPDGWLNNSGPPVVLKSIAPNTMSAFWLDEKDPVLVDIFPCWYAEDMVSTGIVESIKSSGWYPKENRQIIASSLSIASAVRFSLIEFSTSLPIDELIHWSNPAGELALPVNIFATIFWYSSLLLKRS